MIEKFDKSFNLFIFNWFPCLRKKFSQLVVVLSRCIGTINFLRRTINFLVAILWPSASYLNNFITSWIFEREKCLSDTVYLAGWITGWIKYNFTFCFSKFLIFYVWVTSTCLIWTSLSIFCSLSIDFLKIFERPNMAFFSTFYV